MAKQSKPIHLVKLCYGYECAAVCDRYINITPIEATIKRGNYSWRSKGTFDVTKVTCKRCLKTEDYKTAMDKIKYPLFFLKEN